MAIDSEKKRKAVRGIVVPDGTIDEFDRRTVAGNFPVGLDGADAGGGATSPAIEGSTVVIHAARTQSTRSMR